MPADLKDISNLEGYIEHSTSVLIYCSRGYFGSKNCMRELCAAVRQKKQLIALVDPDTSKGGLTLDEIKKEVRKVDQVDGPYSKWEFDKQAPRSDELLQALFRHPPIEWNRISAFQDVTLRLLATRLLPPDTGEVYVQVMPTLPRVQFLKCDVRPPIHQWLHAGRCSLSGTRRSFPADLSPCRCRPFADTRRTLPMLHAGRTGEPAQPKAAKPAQRPQVPRLRLRGQCGR